MVAKQPPGLGVREFDPPFAVNHQKRMLDQFDEIVSRRAVSVKIVSSVRLDAWL